MTWKRGAGQVPDGSPPRLAESLLLCVLPRGAVGDSIAGDLREEYAQRVRTQSARRAAAWYRRQVVGIAWRSARDRLRGHGPFVTRAAAEGRGGLRRDRMTSNMLRALRYGAKGLARSPQFTFAAVLTLALAVGTNAAIFSVVQGVLLKPLRFHDADRLVVLRHSAPGLGYDDFSTSPGLYLLYRAESGAFEASGIHADASVNVTGADAPPARVTASLASRDVFTTLGVTPAAGRVFDEAEDSPGGLPVVMLSHAFWQERFGGAASVVGSTVSIDGTERTVVGVMPAGFEFPNRDTRLWLPLALDTTERAYGNFSFDAIARLRPGIDAGQAQARLQPLLARLRDEPGDAGEFRAFMDAGNLAAVVTPLKQRVVGDVSRALWILLGTVGFVFLIACANVTNLFLVRAEARQKEMAVRAAMGAGRTGLIAHYAAESLLIAAAGGVLGLVMAWGAVRALLRVAPPNIPRLHEVAIDPVVLAFTVMVTLLAAVLLGVLPSLRLTSPDLLATLGRSSRGMTSGRERHRARQVLVVAQTALALVLLVGSGLMVRSFQKMRAIEPGFEPRNAITFRLSLPTATYSDGERMAQFHGQLLERLRAIPGVETVGATSHPPLAGCCSGTAHFIEDFPVEPGQMPPMFWYSTVSDGYFQAMRIPLVAGRLFDTSDRGLERRSVVVSEQLARRLWPDADPIGRRIRLSADTSWYNIIGVVGNVHDRGLELETSDMVYYSVDLGTSQARSMTYVLRTARGADIAPLARAEVWGLDPSLPIASSSTYTKIVADSMIRLSFTMLALVAASAIALILGAIGLYSVISYLVTQRTNEIGIRLALGARPGQVKRMVVLQGARLAILGLGIGLAGAVVLTRLMQSMLYGTEPNDPVTFVVVCGFLAAIALLATYLPAHRASLIDPASSLKAE
jgi:putative ABC transport system permease protein